MGTPAAGHPLDRGLYRGLDRSQIGAYIGAHLRQVAPARRERREVGQRRGDVRVALAQAVCLHVEGVLVGGLDEGALGRVRERPRGGRVGEGEAQGEA